MNNLKKMLFKGHFSFHIKMIRDEDVSLQPNNRGHACIFKQIQTAWLPIIMQIELGLFLELKDWLSICFDNFCPLQAMIDVKRLHLYLSW